MLPCPPGAPARRRSRRRRSRASCRGSTSPRCAWTSRSAAPCWSSSGTSAASNSLRTLPYVRAWHGRYARRRTARDRRAHLRVRALGDRGRGARRGRAARRRLSGRRSTSTSRSGTSTATRAGPARYLLDQRGALFDYHYGEGAYDETERAIQELLGRRARAVAPRAPEDAPGAAARPQTADQRAPTPAHTRRAACGRCSTGAGTVAPTAARSSSTGPGAYPLSSTSATPRACST